MQAGSIGPEDCAALSIEVIGVSPFYLGVSPSIESANGPEGVEKADIAFARRSPQNERSVNRTEGRHPAATVEQ